MISMDTPKDLNFDDVTESPATPEQITNIQQDKIYKLEEEIKLLLAQREALISDFEFLKRIFDYIWRGFKNV